MKAEDQIETMSNFVDAVITTRQAIKYYILQKIKETHGEITYEMFQVLMVLWKKGKINQQEIADTVQKGKASLTPLIDNLTRVNLVTRTEDTADRRNKIISLTKEGQLYQKKFEPMLNEFYTTLNSSVPAEKIKEITGILLKMSNQLSK